MNLVFGILDHLHFILSVEPPFTRFFGAFENVHDSRGQSVDRRIVGFEAQVFGLGRGQNISGKVL
jgi:hypothetical protein